MIQGWPYDEVQRHQHRADGASRPEHAEAKGSDRQHVGEDGQQRYGATEQHRKEIHCEGPEHDALAEHEIDTLTEADKNGLRGACLKGLGGAQRDCQAKRTGETNCHRRIRYVLRMRETVLFAQPNHQASQARSNHARELEERVAPTDTAGDEITGRISAMIA